MRIPVLVAGGVIALAVCLGAVDLKDDPPLIAQPKAGDVTGTIAPGGRVARVEAISRLTQKTYPAASFDKATGKFRFAALPGDADYDIRLTTDGGATVEGIDLSWTESRMDRLAELRRRQLGLPPERQQPFTMADAQAVLKWVDDWKDFMELKRVLYVRGHGKQATVLVELMRTREFYSAGGAYVWRVELWYMQNEFGGWDRLANAERVLHRQRIPPDQWRKISLQYYPQLSVHVDADGRSQPVSFTLPAKPDLSRGRLPDTDPTAKTPIHVSGLDQKPDKVPEGIVIAE